MLSPRRPLLRFALVLATLPLLVVGEATSEEEPPSALVFEGLERDRRGTPVHDFGPVGQQEELRVVIPYRNASDSTLLGIRPLGDCGCYGLTASDEQLAPGERGTLTVDFRTLAFTGRVRKRARLAYLSDGERREAAVALVLEIKRGVVLEPGRIHFGEVLAGTKPSGAVVAQWYDGLGASFEITAVDVPEPYFSAPRPTPYQDPQDKRWKGWRLELRFQTPPPRGVFSERAIIHTTHPRYPRVLLPLTANVVGKVWVQQSRLSLGLVPSGTRRSTSVLLRPFDETIDLGAVSARSRSGKLQVATEVVAGVRNALPMWKVTVTAPPTLVPGKLDDVIEIHTEVPGEEITEIRIVGRIYAARGP